MKPFSYSGKYTVKIATKTPGHQITPRLDIHAVYLVKLSVLVFWWQEIY